MPDAKSRLGRRIPRNGPNTRFAETAWWWKQSFANRSPRLSSLHQGKVQGKNRLICARGERGKIFTRWAR
jgi:hypothetical protein